MRGRLRMAKASLECGPVRSSESAEPGKFWSRVTKGADPDACWLWSGRPGVGGYGRASIGRGRTMLAHRLAYELAVAPVPDGVCVLHRCDNRACVRPDHLFLGDRGDNARDMAAKGRAHLQRNPKAMAGDKHWKRQHPEKVQVAPPKPCSVCGEVIPVGVRQRGAYQGGRCIACGSYWLRHGVERPAGLWGQTSRRRRRSKEWER